jgi:hypothetical protein
MDVIDCNHIVVHTFDGSSSVASFRTIALPKDMDQYKNELEKQYLSKLMDKQSNKDNQDNQASAEIKNALSGLKLEGLSAADQIRKIFGKVRGNTAMRIERALKKMEEKKMKRLRRSREWEELTNAKLPENYENPEDLAAIKYAEETIGDFKLKSSPDYVAPEGQRMNVFKAVERLMQIKQFVRFELFS